MKDLDSGAAKSAKLREMSLLFFRLLVKCRIWTLEVPKVQKLWEPNCVWNEGSGVWGCQKWEKQFGNLTYSTFPTLPSRNPNLLSIWSLQVPEELCGEFAFCAWPHVEQKVWTVEVQKVKLQEMDPPESRVPDRQES